MLAPLRLWLRIRLWAATGRVDYLIDVCLRTGGADSPSINLLERAIDERNRLQSLLERN